MRVWRQGLGLVGDGSRDWMKEKNKMKNNIKGGFEQNNDGSVIHLSSSGIKINK